VNPVVVRLVLGGKGTNWRFTDGQRLAHRASTVMTTAVDITIKVG
jgi:hypothetical protein